MAPGQVQSAKRERYCSLGYRQPTRPLRCGFQAYLRSRSAFIRCNYGCKYNCVSGACSRAMPTLFLSNSSSSNGSSIFYEQKPLKAARRAWYSTAENAPLVSTSGTTIIDNANMPIEQGPVAPPAAKAQILTIPRAIHPEAAPAPQVEPARRVARRLG